MACWNKVETTVSRGLISCQRTVRGGSHPCRRYRTVSETKGRTVCPATFTKIRGASIVGTDGARLGNLFMAAAVYMGRPRGISPS